MSGAFMVAEHYRRLLVEFWSEVCGGDYRTSPALVDDCDKLRPTPVSEVRNCIERMMSVRSSVPMAWRLGDFLAAKGSDLIMARVLASPNVGDALEVIHANHVLFTNIRTVAHRTLGGNRLAVIHREASVDDAIIRFLFQATVAGKLSRLFGIYTASAKQHQVELKAPSFNQLLERLNCELDFLDIDFRDDEVAIAFTPDVLSHRVADVDAQVIAAIDHELRRKASELPASGSWKDQIKSHLRMNNFAEVSLDEVCETFRIQKRTLMRLLRNERTTFTNILSDLRRERAIYLVQHTNVPLKRIAAELGFNSDASFCMAFKSWVGEAPKRYRTKASWRAQANDAVRMRSTRAS